MTDADRVRLAVREGKRMLGPIERERCPHHPTRWVSYRWIWPVGSDPSASEPAVVRGCAACAAEDAARDMEW